MSALLRRVNEGGALMELPVNLEVARFLGESEVMPMTCTPATGAIATTFKIIDAQDDGEGGEGTPDPTDPVNNQVNY